MPKVAVITGGSQGLGLALARQLAADGHVVVLVARGRENLEEAVSEIRKQGGEALACPADVTDFEGVEAVAETVRSRFGTVELLVNNAATLTPARLERLDSDAIRQGLEVTLLGTILVTRAFLPLLERGGRMLFVSSGFGLMGAAGYSVYSAAKGGMVNFADAIRHEVRARDITVHVAVPTDIDTPGFRKEVAELPAWLCVADARNTPLAPEVAARRILAGCRGRRFLVFSDTAVLGLHLANKLLPRFLRNLAIDAMFPRPGPEEEGADPQDPAGRKGDGNPR